MLGHDFQFVATGWQRLAGAQFGAFDQEQVVFIGENSFIHECGETARIGTQLVEHTTCMLRCFHVKDHPVVNGSESWSAALWNSGNRAW